MKALLIADSDTSIHTISSYIRTYGFDIIHYRSALKAIENIEEIAPDAVFISTGDFPRHWKTIVQFIRSDTDKDTAIIILLINDRFSADDADKAVHIGVQAIISETMKASNDEHKLIEVFSRYKHIGMDKYSFTYEPIGDKCVFLFTNPVNDTIITGKVETLSLSGLTFKPDAPSATSDLSAGETLSDCSLKTGSDILTVKCRIIKNTNLMTLEFEPLGEKNSRLLKSFISGN